MWTGKVLKQVNDWKCIHRPYTKNRIKYCINVNKDSQIVVKDIFGSILALNVYTLTVLN